MFIYIHINIQNNFTSVPRKHTAFLTCCVLVVTTHKAEIPPGSPD